MDGESKEKEPDYLFIGQYTHTHTHTAHVGNHWPLSTLIIIVAVLPVVCSCSSSSVGGGVTPDSELDPDRQLEMPRKWASTPGLLPGFIGNYTTNILLDTLRSR